MITNREKVKWQPFSAVIPSNYMIDDVLRKKNKIKMPILSDDQKEELQCKIISYYNNQEVVKVKYFRDGRLYIMGGKITFIDRNRYKIILNGEFPIFFSQIVDFL